MHLSPLAESAPNKALEPTPNSLRSCVAPALGRGSALAWIPTLGKRLNTTTG